MDKAAIVHQNIIQLSITETDLILKCEKSSENRL